MHTQMGDGNTVRLQPSKDFLEEYFFDYAQLGLLETQNHFVRPRQMPKPAKLQTVSIIDTLSELARDGQLENDSLHDRSTFSSVSVSQQGKVQSRHGIAKGEGQTRQDQRLCKKSDSVDIASFDDVRVMGVGAFNKKQFSRMTNASEQQQRLGSSVSQKGKDGLEVFNTMNYNKFAMAGKSKQQYASRDNTVKNSKSKKSHHIPFTEGSNRTVTAARNSTQSCKDISRYCFSDSEIDVSNLSTPKHNFRNFISTKQPSVSCLAVVERPSDDKTYNGWPLNSTDFAVRESPQKNCDLTLPLDIIEQFQDSYKQNKKSDLPPWIHTLFVTARQGNVEMLKLAMVDMDAALVRNLSDRSGNNLWHLCAAYNQLVCIKWLCKCYGDDVLKDENKNGQTPAVLAVKFGSLSVVQWFFEYSSNRCIMYKFDGNRSLLHYAAKYGQVPIVTWLLNVMDKGTDINFLDSYGNTALHLAAKYGHIQCVKELFLQEGDLTLKNDEGLKAYDLALCSNQTACAEYILSLETSSYLSKEHTILKCDINRYKVENHEAKNVIQEVLSLLRDSLNHQKQLLDFVQNLQLLHMEKHEEANHQSESKKNDDRKSELPYLEFQTALDSEVQRWSSVVLKSDEIAYSNISEKWKRICRRNNLQMTVSKHESLDTIRSQFSKIQSKANYYGAMQEASIALLSESSLSDDSGDETYSISRRHNLPEKLRKPRQPWLSRNARQKNCSPKMDSVPFKNEAELKNFKGIEKRLTNLMGKEHSPRASSNHLSNSQLPLSDVDLKELFEQNPSLKQEGRTCSVIEVLEPSSSENEELSQFNSSTCEKTSTMIIAQKQEVTQQQVVQQSYNLTDKSELVPHFSVIQNLPCAEIVQPQSLNIFAENNAKKITNNSTSSQNRKSENPKNSSSENAQIIENEMFLPDNKITLSKSEIMPYRKEALNEISSDCPSCLQESSETNKELETIDSRKGQTGGLKKKGFLLKFSLKNRWSSKQKSCTTKKSSESSSEDSKDTSKGSLDNWEASSSPECDLFFPETEDVSSEMLSLTANEPVMISTNETSKEAIIRKLDLPERLLPPPPSATRRDPPPEPPLDISHFDSSAVIENSSVCLSDIYNSCSLLSEGATSSRNAPDDLNSNEQFCTSSELSRLYSSMGKLDSRPPSSASRIDSSMRIDETYKSVGFPLNKMSSNSTELQVSPGSSTAGRHSPAPSEVSKTESALSPPSDVSKTESQCNMKHLSRIEEILKVQNGHDSGCLGNTLLNMASLAHQNVHCENVAVSNKETLKFEGLPESQVSQEFRPSAVASKKRSSSKPWYDVSDEEDILSPDRYALKDQSTSEDENGELLS